MKNLLLLLAFFMLASCQPTTTMVDEDLSPDETEEVVKTKKFTFTIKGDFSSPTFTRGYMSADGKDMSDLWVLDYLDGTLEQELHLTPEDEEWGAPKMLLKYGNHHIYFVASRGSDAVKNNETHTITWGTVRDTFWKDYEVSVSSSSNGNRAVTLDRVATKLTIVINDEVPEGIGTITATPALWYYGLDWLSGEATAGQEKTVSLDVPVAFVGTSGTLSVILYGISPATEWETVIALKAYDTSSQEIANAETSDIPLQSNRATKISGSLFCCPMTMNLSLNDDWLTPVVMEW